MGVHSSQHHAIPSVKPSNRFRVIWFVAARTRTGVENLLFFRRKGDQDQWLFLTTAFNFQKFIHNVVIFALPVDSGPGLLQCMPALELHRQVGSMLDSVKWDDKGLAVAIAKNVDSGAVCELRGPFNDHFFQKGNIL
ncbi:hypothetical protein ACS0TY_006754 [Phlomoides rotata]